MACYLSCITRELTEKDLVHLTEEQAREIYRQGEEAVVWALLKLSVPRQVENSKAGDLATPSSQIAPCEKPTAKRRRKKRGREPGHKGEHRRGVRLRDLTFCTRTLGWHAVLGLG